MTRLIGLALVLVGISLVTAGTLVIFDGSIDIEAGTLLLGIGAVIVGRGLRSRGEGRWVIAGLVLAGVAVALSIWGFSGSFEHDEYPAFGGIALFGIAGLIIGAGL